MLTQVVKGGAAYNSSCSWPSHDSTKVWGAFWENIDHFVPQETPSNNNMSNAILHGMENAYLENISGEQQEENKRGKRSCLRHSYVVVEPGLALNDVFSPKDVLSPNDVISPSNALNGVLETFEGDKEDVQSENLLELGWDSSSSLENIDKLFQGSNTLLSPSSNDFLDGILWPSISPQSGNTLLPPSLRQSKVEVSEPWGLGSISEIVDDGSKVIEFIPRETKSECINNNMEIADKPLFDAGFAMINREEQTETLPLVQGLSPPDRQLCLEADNAKTESLSTMVTKNENPRKLLRQWEKNIRKLKQRRILAVVPEEYSQGGLGFMQSLTTLHEFGSGGLSPITPQQKLEKVHWHRQKNQGTDNSLPKLANNNNNNNSPVQLGSEPCLGSVTVAQMNPNEGSVEGTVLQQLESSISNLDTSTRLCIRDACYRLACSSTERQMLSGIGRPEFKSSHYQMEDGIVTHGDENMATSKRSMEFETETNRIDRLIVQLLFPKAFPSNEGHVTSTL